MVVLAIASSGCYRARSLLPLQAVAVVHWPGRGFFLSSDTRCCSFSKRLETSMAEPHEAGPVS